MATTASDPGAPPPASCSRCGALPDTLTVNTCRDQQFPEAYYALERLGATIREPLRRCGLCRTFFRWIDLPQTYGSGNCDEEQLDRLSPELSALLDRLFPAEDAPPPELGEAHDYFARIPHELLVRALEGHVFTRPALVAPFVPGLARRLARGVDDGAGSLLSNYRYQKPARAKELLALLDGLGTAPLAPAAERLREACLATLADEGAPGP